MKLCSTCRLARQSCESAGGPTSRLPRGDIGRRPPHCMVVGSCSCDEVMRMVMIMMCEDRTQHTASFFFLMNSGLFSLWAYKLHRKHSHEYLARTMFCDTHFVIYLNRSTYSRVLGCWGVLSSAITDLDQHSFLRPPCRGLCSCGLKCCRSGTTSFKT